MTLIEFNEKFRTEEDCYEYLYEQKYKDGFKCSCCGGKQEPYHIKTRNLLTCRNCGKQTTVLVGTVMEKTHLPLLKWFYAFWLVANDKRGCSATFLSKELKIHYHNAWYLLKRIQTAMMKEEEEFLLSGVVEVDESYVGASSEDTKPGRGTDKTEIMLAVEIASFTNKEGEECLNPMHIKSEVVPDTTGETVKNFIKNNVEAGSTVKTDGFSSYQVIEKDGYTNVAEKIGEDENKLHLLWFHIIIANLKSFIQGTYHGLDEKHLHFYLSEFCWRYNRRKLNLFELLVSSAASSAKIQCCELKG
jgi:transposase-like protein